MKTKICAVCGKEWIVSRQNKAAIYICRDCIKFYKKTRKKARK